MPTYDYSGDGNGVIHNEFFRNYVVMKREVKVSDVIASDITLTTNGVIAAGDIIQLIDVPVGFVLLNCVIKTVTAEGAALEADFGLAGGDEIIDGFSLNQAAGTLTIMGVADDYGANSVMGVTFATADTIDMNFTSETDAGEWHAYFAGIFLN